MHVNEDHTRIVDVEEIKKAAERKRILDEADRKAKGTIKKAEQAEAVNFQTLVRPVNQVKQAEREKERVRNTIAAFKDLTGQKTSEASPPPKPIK